MKVVADSMTWSPFVRMGGCNGPADVRRRRKSSRFLRWCGCTRGLRDGIKVRSQAIEGLLSHLTIQEEQKKTDHGPFVDMTFCVTGTLSEPRKSIQSRIKAAGGKVVGSVSGNLSVLVAGENAGSKLAKAESLGVTVWSEKLLNEQILNESISNESVDKASSEQPTLFDY